MRTTIKNNQHGMASIMFAMFLVLGISLLAIGFATLVRNDQRQAIDKTLSNQAQYAAESAISKAQQIIKADPLSPTIHANCSDPGGNYNITTDGSIKVTCLTWKTELETLHYNNVDISPVSTPIDTPSGTSNLVLIWQPGESNTSSIVPYSSNPGQLQLLGNHIPTLRIVFADATSSDISASARVVYLNPTSDPGTGSVDSTNKGSGFIGDAKCAGSPISCSIVIKNVDLGTKGLLAISSLNGQSNVQVQAIYNSIPAPQRFWDNYGLNATYYCNVNKTPPAYSYNFLTNGSPTTASTVNPVPAINMKWDNNLVFAGGWPGGMSGLPDCTKTHYFGAKWQGRFTPTTAGNYQFGGWEDDAMMITITITADNRVVYNNSSQSGNPFSSWFGAPERFGGVGGVSGQSINLDPATMPAGGYPIEIDYYDVYGWGAEARPRYKGPDGVIKQFAGNVINTGVSRDEPSAPVPVTQLISGAQAKIDANAKSQDVSKRLVAYVSLPTTTAWHPGFVVSGDALCKNYKLGLGNNDQAGPVSGTLCPQ